MHRHLDAIDAATYKLFIHKFDTERAKFSRHVKSGKFKSTQHAVHQTAMELPRKRRNISARLAFYRENKDAINAEADKQGVGYQSILSEWWADELQTNRDQEWVELAAKMTDERDEVMEKEHADWEHPQIYK